MAKSSFANPVSSLSVLENFKTPKSLQQSRTVLAIVRENSLRFGRQAAAPPAAPTEASAIFTPGPMVELMEIFFI